jgi:hypothetical protein
VNPLPNYPGSKGGAGVAKRLISEMPPHRVYIEAFLGGGAVLRLKRPAAVNIGIDADGRVIETWVRSGATSYPTLAAAEPMMVETLQWVLGERPEHEEMVQKMRRFLPGGNRHGS